MKIRHIASIIAMALAVAPAGCDQGGGKTSDDVQVDDGTELDTLEDTVPADVLDEDAALDTSTPDGEDTVEDAPIVIPEPGTYTESMIVDGVTRTYVINVPVTACAAMASGRVPFLIGLHGAGDTGSNFITATRLTDLASANAFVVVGPDGFNRGWFVQSSEGWPGTDGHSSSLENDVDYMLALIDLGYESYGIDRNRVYVVGHSRGAGMTGLLAITSGRLTTSTALYVSPFAAYGVNAGYDAYGGSSDLSVPAPKRPIWIIHGTADSVVPFSEGQGFANDLEAAGWDVTFTSITGAGHTWLWQSSFGYTNQDLWDFFAANPLP